MAITFATSPRSRHKRILSNFPAKLMSEQTYGIDPAVATRIAKGIAKSRAWGWKPRSSSVAATSSRRRGERARHGPRDRGLRGAGHCDQRAALQTRSSSKHVVTRVVTAIEMRAVAEPFIRRRLIRHPKGRVVVFAPAPAILLQHRHAAARAMETKPTSSKGTKVDRIYDADPMVKTDAVRFDRISYQQVSSRGSR
jgi:uridylate kinase